MEQVIYRATPGRNLMQVLYLLRQAGLTPMVLDNEAPDEVLRYASAYNYRVRVAVPEEQAERAREVLAPVETEGREALARHVRQFHRMLFHALLIALGVVGLGLFLGRHPRDGAGEEVSWPQVLGLTLIFTVGGLYFLSFLSVRRKRKRRAIARNQA
jgi:hypothetical protein